jgi:hypothetical protein
MLFAEGMFASCDGGPAAASIGYRWSNLRSGCDCQQVLLKKPPRGSLALTLAHIRDDHWTESRDEETLRASRPSNAL